jgi:hypothetical protein
LDVSSSRERVTLKSFEPMPINSRRGMKRCLAPDRI